MTEFNPFEWAQLFAAANHAVLPLHSATGGVCSCDTPRCDAPGKHPRLSNGLQGATTDPAKLGEWRRSYPDANWGVRCDRLVVFDADDTDSADALLKLAESRGGTPGLTVTTGRGVHLYYLSGSDASFRQWTNKVPGLRVDLKAGPSYVVVPGGSHVSGAVYTPSGTIDSITDLPGWAVPIAAGDLVRGGRASWARNLREELEQPPSIGSRHSWVARVCGLLAKLLSEYHELYGAAVAAGVLCLPDLSGFPEAEWERIRDDIWDREQTHAGSAGITGGRGPSTASVLLAIAHDLYDTVLLETGVAAVVSKSGPNVAILLSDRGPQSARAKLAAQFFEREGRSASSTALSEAIETLAGQAGAQTPVTAHMRVGALGTGIVVDVGDPDGQAICITPGGWAVLPRSPSLMYRTNASSPLPIPRRRDGGGLSQLRRLFNVTDEQFDLIVTWWVAAMVLPDAPVPVLVFSGPPGVAKSTATEFAVQLIDPSAVPRRTFGRQADFHVVTSATRIVPIENLSSMAKWLSDRIAAAVTGDGQILRTLYETTGITVVAYRRVFVLNGVGIAESISAADLADRTMVIEPHSISADRRLTERELHETFTSLHPAALAEVLDLAAETLVKLPSVRLDRPPRMADFARICVAVDAIRGTRTLNLYLAGHAAMSDSLLAEGSFGGELLDLIERKAQRDADGLWAFETSATQIRTHMAERMGHKDLPPVNQIRHEIDLVRPRLGEEGWHFDVVKSGPRRRYRFRSQTLDGTIGTAGTAASIPDKSGGREPQGMNLEADTLRSPQDGDRRPVSSSSPFSAREIEALRANWQRLYERQQGAT